MLHLSKSPGVNAPFLPLYAVCVMLTAYSLKLTAFMVEVNGFEPMTSCVQSRRSSI